MKNIFKYTLLSLLMGLLVFATSCEEKAWSEDYDIELPIPQIDQVSKSGAVDIGSVITVTGANFDKATAKIGDAECIVSDISADKKSMKVTLPRTFKEGALSVYNLYGRFSSSAEIFTPIYPDVTVTKVNDIGVNLVFSIVGTNVDIITNVYINGKEVVITARDANKISANSAGIGLYVGQLVTVSFKGLSNEIPAISNVNVVFPFINYNEYILWDWEDGAQDYSSNLANEGTATVQSGASNVPGNADKFFQLRAPGYGWTKATGEISLSEVPDLSNFVEPYITFYVRTPVGSGGYFQMEDQAGHWRHFGGNFNYNTAGEWVLFSEPLKANWEGGEFRISAFKPKLGFKAGNAGEKMDIDIAYIKITEGKYDNVLKPGDQIGNSAYPSVTNLMNFEDTSLTPDILNGSNVVGSVNFRHTGADAISAFNGTNFFTFVDDGTIANNSWGAYWSSTLIINTASVDLTKIPTPTLSFQMNTGANDGQQYIVVRFYQYDGGLTLIKKFFPNSLGLWTPGQVDLFGKMDENWSDASTPLGAHYKTLTKLSKDAPIEKIEIIASKNSSNKILISFDEFAITNGPRY